MNVSDFDFELPPDLIAQAPARPRDSARLLRVAESLRDLRISDLPSLVRAGDVMVFNDTRVIPARLAGHRGAAKVEVTLTNRRGDGTWDALAKPARRLKPGERVDFAPGFAATIEEKRLGGEVTLAFGLSDADLRHALDIHGIVPLPPYIKRPKGASEPADRADYQTVYAAHDGAVAAPTAGFHFTPELMTALKAQGVATAFVTLHVGVGTFQPVKVEDTAEHVMHAEWGAITQEAADMVNAAHAKGGRVIAVGTTSLRLLESATTDDGTVHPFQGATDIFITPGYRFKCVDALLTNFHLPRSTLFMLVAAFSGLDVMHRAYAHAIARGYRFYSYGDACFLEKAG
jgi:S-adenosylmethionine:tRNA ribosyltransferase-isomerase